MGEQPEISPADEMVVVEEAEFRRLPGWIAIYRAGVALVLGDVTGTVKYARRALDLVPEEDHLGRGAAAGLLGLAYWTNGDLEAAHRSYAEGMRGCRRPGTSLMQLAAPSPWQISGSRKATCARQCAPMSGDCSLLDRAG